MLKTVFKRLLLLVVTLLLVTVLAVALTIATGILVYQTAEPEETQPQEAPRNRIYTTSVVTDEP